MKNFRFSILRLSLAIGMAAITFNACNKDEVGSVSDLCGTWRLTIDEGYYTPQGGKKETWKVSGDDLATYYMVINEDGTGWEDFEGEGKQAFTHEFKNKKN